MFIVSKDDEGEPNPKPPTQSVLTKGHEPASKKGFFHICPYPIGTKDNPLEPYDINFSQDLTYVGKIPDDQAALTLEVQRSLAVLRGVFKVGDKKFSDYFEELGSLASVGLSGANVQTSLATVTLKEFQTRFVNAEKGTRSARLDRAQTGIRLAATRSR